MINTNQALRCILLLVLGIGSAMAAEEAKYTVLLKEENFEIREYAPQLLAETLVKADFDSAGNIAFGTLYSYITGNNRSRQTIDRTSQLTQEAESEEIEMTRPVSQMRVEGRWAISFVMPRSYSLDTLPEPKDPKVTLRQVPARLMASIRYSGIWSEKGYKRNKNKLDAWIKENRLGVIGEPIWARYNAPFMPWFLRRNEILIPVADPSGND